jgi:hypothetical protein
MRGGRADRPRSFRCTSVPDAFRSFDALLAHALFECLASDGKHVEKGQNPCELHRTTPTRKSPVDGLRRTANAHRKRCTTGLLPTSTNDDVDVMRRRQQRHAREAQS